MPLVSHRFPVSQALEAYTLLDQSAGLGIILQYPEPPDAALRHDTIVLKPSPQPSLSAALCTGRRDDWRRELRRTSLTAGRTNDAGPPQNHCLQWGGEWDANGP